MHNVVTETGALIQSLPVVLMGVRQNGGQHGGNYLASGWTRGGCERHGMDAEGGRARALQGGSVDRDGSICEAGQLDHAEKRQVRNLVPRMEGGSRTLSNPPRRRCH